MDRNIDLQFEHMWPRNQGNLDLPDVDSIVEKTEKIRLTISVGICIALRGMEDGIEHIGSHELAYKQEYAIFTHFRGRVSERMGLARYVY